MAAQFAQALLQVIVHHACFNLNDTYDEQAALNPVFLFAYTLLQVPKTVFADHMLHAAGILLCCPWIDTCLR